MKRQSVLKGIGLTAAAAMVGIGLAGCAIDSQGGSTEEGTVTIGTLRGQPHLYQPYFYDQFAPDGTEIDIVLFDSSPDIKNAIVSGSIDFGIAGIPSAVSGISQGEEIKVVASAADGGSNLVGGEEIETLDDLVGANVGYPQGSSQEILLRLTLAEAGVDIDEVNLINLPFSDMATAFEGGSIDAFLSAELGPSTALQNGAHIIASPYETEVGRVNLGLITTTELIESDPELVQSVVDMHTESIDYMLENTEEWSDGLVETFGLEKDIVDTAIENIWLRYDISDEYLTQVDALTAQMELLTTIEEAPSTDDIFDTQFLE
ncbi:ABC transporter substrate-binding protein [Marisediminicola sp. LYQ85]|uniref:ABC transporter substrate-binding protein n=1 Tax=Marisediminicola sp. LYQ85 TaxID=3391062 RepID=UPI00398326CA